MRKFVYIVSVTGTLLMSVLVLFTICQSFSWAAELLTTSPRLLSVSPKVLSVVPNSVVVAAGGAEAVLTFSGTGLDRITACVLIRSGRPVSGVTTTLGAQAQSSRTVTLKAGASVPTGDAQLRLIAGTTSIDLPLTVARISISSKATTTVVTGTQLQTTTTAISPTMAQTLAPSTATTITAVKSARLTTTTFAALVSTVFSGAYIEVLSIPFPPVHASMISVPGTYNKQEFLAVLDENLPDQVKIETTREAISYSSNPPMVRDGRIQAKMERIKTLPWTGFIEGGKLKIRLQFDPNRFVKTYKLLEKRNDGKWENYESYNRDFADAESPDYSYIALCLDVYLVPTVDNGRLSYTLPSAKWYWYKDNGFWWPEGALVSNPFATPYGHPMEKAMLEKYKNDIMNTLQQRIVSAFAGYEIKNLLTTALNSKVKSGDNSNQRIGSTSVSEDGTTIIIQFR